MVPAECNKLQLSVLIPGSRRKQGNEEKRSIPYLVSLICQNLGARPYIVAKD
jgi:hypothetical protein